MKESNSLIPINSIQRICLLVLTIGLGFLLFNTQFNSLNKKNNLEKLARQSMSPEIAINNHKPSIFEFYADWCEVCQEMSSSMLSMTNKYNNQINFVFLNVDNPLWENYINKFNVNGIPYIVSFDSDGKYYDSFNGYKSEEEINSFLNALNA
tara:strand:+ start:19356 stop:19811 length:456 start_codon:yes stop_codon:yes gene_type:complete